MDTSTTTPTGVKVVNNYQYIFGKVLNKRLKFILNINILLALLISIILRLPFGQFWFNLLLTISIRGPILFLAFSLIRQARKTHSTVDYTIHKTLGSQIYYTLFSMNFLTNSIYYVLSGYLIAGVFIFQLSFTFDYYLLSKEYRKNPLINDQWVFYWYYPLFMGLFYSCHQLIFQRNRLQFEYGHTKKNPANYLFGHLPQLLGNSIGLNIFITLLTPASYWIIKPLIYKANILIILLLGLDTKIPMNNTTWTTYFQLAFLSNITLLSWEIINHAFNVYATIGCLDGKKPISTYSSDPIHCLLSGLRNVDPDYQLSRLTAFQELAYIATTTEPDGKKLRSAIFSARSKKGYVWPAIFDECSLIIKETTDRINYRTAADLKALKESQINIKGDVNIGLRGRNRGGSVVDDDIFGNSFISSPIAKSSPVSPLKSYGDTLDSKKIEEKTTNPLVIFINQSLVVPLQSLISTFSTGVNTKDQKFLTQLKSIYTKLSQIYNIYHQKFLQTWLGLFFRTTLKRDTESRVINPVNFGNAIIAISNLLQHSVEEDKNNTITANDVSEILNLLERPIRACSNYTDYIPASVYLSQQQRDNPRIAKRHLIAILHDLTMHEFYENCVKFNGKLNDLVLNPRTYKLAKWVIDIAIAEQQQSIRTHV
ncbi:NDC1 [[Candida] subhashii]|uniref:NDC1 n=1 Tax=[Candida] subhashii TaxID=561895 RepID=A0A8J5QL27_9ASCO|nr:NDC1 [[Candida] subhashii]KAG7662452.1 NDC1 [[Candida] subhashii]